MKRSCYVSCYFIALMALSSSAHADSFSFAVAGRTIRIEAPRHCRAASCVSLSIPGIYRSKRWQDRDDEVAAAPAPPSVNPPARAVAPVAAPAAPASQPPVQAVALAPPPPAPPPVPAQIIVLPAPLPNVEPVKTMPVESPPVLRGHVDATEREVTRDVLEEVDELEPGADVVGGGDQFVVMAGPCAVESEQQLITTAEAIAAAGARILRGGAFKPRSSPYSFQGLGLPGRPQTSR